jgi:hypothetical protein
MPTPAIVWLHAPARMSSYINIKSPFRVGAWAFAPKFAIRIAADINISEKIRFMVFAPLLKVM